jgi:hypothetical protein
MAIYKGKIRIEGLGVAVNVSADCGNSSEAKKIINNQYKVKSWVKQPSRQ